MNNQPDKPLINEYKRNWGIVSGFGLIFFMIVIGFADGDDYWAEGGMPLPGESKIESTE